MNPRAGRLTLTIPMALAVIGLARLPLAAQHDPKLHINTRWEECSLQLDPALTQAAWRQFTEEAGLVVYFRPLADARPLGRGNFEVSMLRWGTAIDDSDSAWNDTFVHPDSTHWLFDGDRLNFPGLTVRVGVADRTDVGVYVTKSIGANYGFYGAQVQQNVLGGPDDPWAGAARLSFVSMYGPEDLGFTVYGADLLGSRTITLSRLASVSPYVGVAGYLATSHEKSDLVDLEDERVTGAQASVGAALRVWKASIAAEYSVARVNSLSFRFGMGRQPPS